MYEEGLCVTLHRYRILAKLETGGGCEIFLRRKHVAALNVRRGGQGGHARRVSSGQSLQQGLESPN